MNDYCGLGATRAAMFASAARNRDICIPMEKN